MRKQRWMKSKNGKLLMSKNKIWWLCFAVIACSADNADSNRIFHLAESRGKLENSLITEASGMVEGLNNPGLLWTHNDSGNEPALFLLDDYGRNKGSFILHGVDNRDWEDIASGSGPEEGKNYIYIAEIGDNNAVYDYKYIYRFEEPVAGSMEKIQNFDTITFQYPDGKRDAECLMLDPLSKDLYVISKREKEVTVYLAAYPQATTEVIILEKLGTLPFNNIVAGDISSDGTGILLKTYDKIFYWEHSKGTALINTLQKKPIEIAYDPEPQGESIAWRKDGSGFFTLSEERNRIAAVLYFYKKR